MKGLKKKQQAQYEKLHDALTEAAVAFNAARDEFEAFREEIVSDAVAYMDAQLTRYSDSWADSEAGEQFQQWLYAWEDESVPEAEEPSAYPMTTDEA